MRKGTFTLGLLVVLAAVLVVGVPSASAYTGADPLTAPGNWTSSGGSLIENYINGTTSTTNYTVDNYGPDATSMLSSEEIVPAAETVPGLQLITLAVGAGLLGWEIGSTANHLWLHMGTDPRPTGLTDGVWSYTSVGHYGIGPGWYFGGTSGHGSNIRGCESGSSGCDNTGGMIDYYNGIQLLTQGAIMPADDGGCSNCFTRFMGTLPMTGPPSTSSPGGMTTSTTSGWANPTTGAGVTTTAPTFGTSTNPPAPQCLQGDTVQVGVTCTSADPSGGPVQPKHGFPPGWTSTDNPNGNNLRCQLDPSSTECPTPNGSGTDWSSNGGAATNFTMPDCFGLTLTVCEGAISAAADGAHVTPPLYTELELGIGLAVLTQPAGAVITTSVPAGTSVVPGSVTTVTISYNPDPLPVVIPMPAPWTLADPYCDELTAAGLTCVVITLTDPDPTHGPGELTHTSLVPGTRQVPGTTITILKNPTTTTGGDPVPYPPGDPNDPGTHTEPTPGTLPVPGGTGDGCNCPPFDFTPMTSLSFGNRFPFGAFAYVTAVLSVFNVEPHAPGFDIVVTPQTGGKTIPFGSRHFTGDLSFLDDYMTIVRTLMAWALWIGAIWFVGARLLGFSAAGDLSEAADDGGVV